MQQKQQTDLLVEILQIHDNHLHEIDNTVKSINETLFEIIAAHPAFVTSITAAILTKIMDIYTKVASAISQAQLKWLSPLIFPNDVLVAVKNHIEKFAKS